LRRGLEVLAVPEEKVPGLSRHPPCCLAAHPNQDGYMAQCGLHRGPSLGNDPPMAIQFARARYISRSSGGSAVRSAAYNGRAAITAERTGELYYFRHRDAPEHHEVLLPESAAERFREAGVLWNAAEAAEKRKDAQVAREIVLALPANAGISREDRIELARSFAVEHFVASL
jgi:hypothetical protein